MSENSKTARVRKGKTFAPGYKGKGMCGLCFCSESLTYVSDFGPKTTIQWCGKYKKKAVYVAKNCKENM